MGEEDESHHRNTTPPPPPPRRNRPPYQEKQESMKLWGILIFGIIGATATTFAVGQLRRTVDFFYSQFTRSRSSGTGRESSGRSFRSSFQEEAWKKYNRRMQEEYEEEMERVERIRRMQSVFNRERNKYKKSYESWRENGQGAYHQHFQRDDWYWKSDTTHKDRKSNFRETPRGSSSYLLSHHYTVLGLDRLWAALILYWSEWTYILPGLVMKRFNFENVTHFVVPSNRSRTQPYSESEIKTAFRSKAKEFHPDQNLDNKEAAEEKFKEVMTSYEAIKEERKGMKA